MLQETKVVLRKPTKSISGVMPLTVVLPPRKCWHGTCSYCPGGEYAPQSYTPKSPSVITAIELNYDPYKQVMAKLKNAQIMGHPTDKIELIIIGGTFMQYHLNFRDEFVKRCFDALNGFTSGSLEEAQRINENSKNRCVAFCIENRPDNCSIFHIQKMREYGATRIEIGVQALDDNINKITNRGHNVKDVIVSTERLKNAGFKVGYHIMPGLPGSNLKKDIEMFKKLFSSQDFKPDQLKIYPCQVVQDTQLEKDYFEGKFKPYTKEQLEKLLVEMLTIVPRYCRVMRVMREFPQEYLVAGTTRLDLRNEVEDQMRKNNKKLEEIRYREIGFNSKIKNFDTNLKLKVTKYKASNGQEYFLEFVNKDDVLFGLLRLRFPNKTVDLPELKNCALIRELHVYGKALELGEKADAKDKTQHSGLGKKLMEKAEEIAFNSGFKKIAVISGIGVKEYYRKLGYKDVESYMIKEF